jgi:formylglycine-generating enzyme required for sulfatase activity
MLAVRPGSFEMGISPEEDRREGVPITARFRSAPQHTVTIGYAFALGMFEVTKGQFAAFVEATGHATGDSCAIAQPNATFVVAVDQDWRDPGFEQTIDDPVTCINYLDAEAYAAWLTRLTGVRYRLPSEAEWEYAARAGAKTARHWGDGHDEACTYANVADASLAEPFGRNRLPPMRFACSDGHAFTAPVGRLKPNDFGLHDMLGNVWEITADCWNETYNGAPTDGSAWTASALGDCTARVARGGSWVSYPRSVRSGSRDRSHAVRANTVGFRVARDGSAISLLRLSGTGMAPAR